MGIPIVELGNDKWHVNVMQKVPLSRDRDNVNSSYLGRIRAYVLNAKFDELVTDEDKGANWVTEAMAKADKKAFKGVMKARFGDKFVSRSVRDTGSAKEAFSKGFNIIEGGLLL